MAEAARNAHLDEAEIGVLSASVAAALIGLAFLHHSLPRAAESAGRGEVRPAQAD